MSPERWLDPASNIDLDTRRREWFEAWCEQELARRGVQWGDYARMREDGTWNDYAREYMRGQFMVEEG